MEGITAAVHQAEGTIFLQLRHVGRMSHPDYLGGDLPVAPSEKKFYRTQFSFMQ